jgi:nitrate reductase beta subunit
MSEEMIYNLYRLLAIAKYEDRYVIPKAHAETARDLEELACSLDVSGGPGQYKLGPFGAASSRPVPVAVETFHALKVRQTSEVLIPLDDVRMNLQNWHGNGTTND